MPFVDDMEEETAIPRRVKQAPETVSAPVLHDFRVTLKRSVFISVFPQTVNCQTITPGVNWRCPMTSSISLKYFLRSNFLNKISSKDLPMVCFVVTQHSESELSLCLRYSKTSCRRQLKKSIFQNCQTVTPGVNWRCPKKQEPVLVKPIFPFQKL